MDLGPLPTVTQGSISDQVYEILRERILSNHAVPGERLKLAEIQGQMGVSRTPLQQALNRLATEGLIEIVPRKGTYVTEPTATDIEEVFELRRILETYAARLAVQSMTAAQCDALCALVDKMKLVQSGTGSRVRRTYSRLDQEFHQLIVDGSANKHLKKLWSQVNAQVRIARIYGKPEAPLSVVTERHAEIAEAFVARDGARAHKLLAEHIREAKRALLSRLESTDHPSHDA